MSLAWFPPSETDHDFGKRELSSYEQFLEEQRQHRELEKQVRKYGDDAMRVDPQMNLTDAASSMPTESFTRAYQMRMPGSKAEKVKEKDPLASLMKALNIDVKKSRETQTGDGTKHSHGTDKEKQKFHGSRNRYPRMRADREQTEAFAQDTA